MVMSKAPDRIWAWPIDRPLFCSDENPSNRTAADFLRSTPARLHADELAEALRTLEPALKRDMGAGYAGVALIQAVLAKLEKEEGK